jgi:hypothetical protein
MRGVLIELSVYLLHIYIRNINSYYNLDPSETNLSSYRYVDAFFSRKSLRDVKSAKLTQMLDIVL